MNLIARLTQLACFALGSLFFLAADPAQAQYPCSGAPGEQMVAVKTEPGGATVPLCVSGASPQSGTVSQGTFAAFAFHPDASDLWVDGSYTGPDHSGPRISLEQCNRAMGGGCVAGGDWSNTTMVVYRNARGELHWGWSYDKASVKQAEKNCRGNSILPCERVLKLGSNTRERFPGANVRKRYLVAVWVKGTEGYDGKLYIASGEPTYAAAFGKAMTACQSATSRECEFVEYTGGGVLQTYGYDKGHGVMVETTAARVTKSAQAKCKTDKLKCTMRAQYDARSPGLYVHDFRAGQPQAK